jgi:poly(3-hydroxybutyrate) depolymerase
VTYILPISMTWSLVNGTNSINLTATPNHNLTVYYAVHNTNPGALTSAAVKALSGSCSGSCVAASSFAAVTTGSTQSISALADKALYYVSAVAEDAVGLQATPQTYSGVLPRRNSMQIYNTALTSEQGVGVTIRYYIYVPTAYYNNPTTNYPVVMYLHGFGDQSNNIANPEGDFASMNQTVISGKIAMGDNFNAIVIQPQCNEGLWDCQNYKSTTMSTPYLAEVVDRVNATYRTNTKRFSVTGMSFGASGALHLAYDYPAKISAIAPIAGGLFTTGTRPAASGNLCPKFATEPVAVWAFNNTLDGLFNSAGVTGGATGSGSGTYPGTIISTVNGNCTGHPDARITEFTENSTFPTSFNTHHISEMVVNGPYFDYFDACGNSGGTWLWKYWTGATCTNDTVPPSNKVPLHPLVTTDLQAASTALTGSSSTFTTVFDWMTFFSKP